MTRYNKQFTVRPMQDNRLEVLYEGTRLYVLGADTWRSQLKQWRSTGWDIVWA